MQASETTIYTCTICNGAYTTREEAVNCHLQAKCCGAYRFAGPFPGYQCRECGKLFYYQDRPNPGYLVLDERRKDAEHDANLCCDKDAPINRTGEKLDSKPE